MCQKGCLGDGASVEYVATWVMGILWSKAHRMESILLSEELAMCESECVTDVEAHDLNESPLEPPEVYNWFLVLVLNQSKAWTI